MGLLTWIYGVGGKLRNILTRAWNLLQSPITGLVITLTGPVLYIVINDPALQNPAVFYFGVSLMLASGSLIVTAKIVDRLRRRLRTISGGLAAMYLAFINFAAYYRDLPHSMIRAYITLLLGVAFLTLGVMTLLSIKIKWLEKVLRLKAEETS